MNDPLNNPLVWAYVIIMSVISAIVIWGQFAPPNDPPPNEEE